MSKPSLSVALGVRRHAKQKHSAPAAGESKDEGMGKSCVFDHKDLAQAVIKKMSGGGMVEESDDFLSSDADTEMHSEAMPDDSDERADAMSSKGMLKGIMAKRRR